MKVEFSVNLYLKSGKILSSDLVTTTQDTAWQLMTGFMNIMNLPNSLTIDFIRNGYKVLIPISSIDYIEFITDQVDDDATA